MTSLDLNKKNIIKIITGNYLVNTVPVKGNKRKIQTDTSGHERQKKKTTTSETAMMRKERAAEVKSGERRAR